MLYVHGAGHFHPENVIDNHFLESLDIDTTDQWIVDRVGVHSRRTVLSLDYIRDTRNANPADALDAAQYTNAQTGAHAGREALRRAGLSPADIGMVVAGSCTPQFSCPAEACTIAAELDIDGPSLDINSACSSLAAQVHLLNNMHPDALPDYVLVVNPDNSTPHIDYSDRNNCVLWGDGSAALVVSPRAPAAMRIVNSSFTSQPAGWDKVQFLPHGHFRQEGRTVQTFAIKRTIALIRSLGENVDGHLKFIGHQANLTMLKSVCKRAGVEADNHFFNVDEFGNCGAAGAPSVLSQHWNQFGAGDQLVVAVVGSGLSWGGMLIDVQDTVQ
ncbi:MAG: ketoacyl-ACP synthase III [Pseudomonadota bacterium]